MTTPLWCLVTVAFLPYVLAGVGGYFKQKQFGRVDNKEPRVQGNQLTGAGGRAWAAQQNAWEALSLFGVAVVVAHLAGADPGASATASLVFVATRVLHPVAYLANQDLLRSLVFMIGFGCCVWLVVLAGLA